MTKPICNRPCHGAPPLLWVRVIARGASPRQPGAQPPGNLGAPPQDHLPLHMFMFSSSSLIKRSPPRAAGARGAPFYKRRRGKHKHIKSEAEEHVPLRADPLLDSLRRSSVKIGTIQRRLARPLRKDDTRKSRSVSIFCPF